LLNRNSGKIAGFSRRSFTKSHEEKEIHSLDLSKLEEDDRKIISYLQDHEKATAKELETF
jgi:hypothetical protein